MKAPLLKFKRQVEAEYKELCSQKGGVAEKKTELKIRFKTL